MKHLKLLTKCLLATLFVVVSQAQDGHYWTRQYGTRSMLLSGSVIGGVEDLGAVYYNPARLGQIENPAFLLSADVYELNKLTIEDAFGNNANTKKQEFGGVPSLAAGTFKIPFLKKHHFAWAIMLRNKSDLSFSYFNEVNEDVFDNFPGEEYFGAELSISQNIKEEWTGLTWSYPISDKLSVGVSGYLALNDIAKGSKINLQAMAEDKRVAVYRQNKSYTKQQYSIMGKIGLSYKLNSMLLGLTVLTPRAKLKGNGNYSYELLFSGIEGITETEDTYTTSYQSGLQSKIKSPWSVGAGLTYFTGNSKIHLSSEWFSAIPKYTIMEAEDHVSQSHPDTILGFRLVDKLHYVINIGLGAEFYINEKISFYSSVCTDYSAVTSDLNKFLEFEKETANSVFKANYYHYAGGFVLKLRGADITLGATYTGAKQDFERPFNFPDEENEDLFDSGETATLKWSRWRFIFSFSMPFLKDVQKKVEEKMGF